MSSSAGGAGPEPSGESHDEGHPSHRRAAARVARLLRWYPINWRERYGDEFEAVLLSSLGDGKGGLRFSLDVAREGLMARLDQAGLVGQSTPPLLRARASVMSALVGIIGFLASAAGLSYYARGWQRTPALESIDTASQALARSKAERTYQQTLALPGFEQLHRAALHSSNGTSGAWKAWEKAQAQAAHALSQTEAGRALQSAIRHRHAASGAPVVFNDVAHLAIEATITVLGVALLVASTVGVRSLRGPSRRRLLTPLCLLGASSVLLVVGEIAYRAGQNIPLGQPSSEWTTLKWMMEGNFRFWPVVVFPVCTAVSVLFSLIGGVGLFRRVDFESRVLRVLGSLAVAAAGCLGVVVVSTLAWAGTLETQAPGFLTARDQGVLGSSFLPVLLVATVVMIGTCALATAGSARCLRSVRSLTLA